MRGLKTLLIVCVVFAAILAIITSFIVLGYIIKILAVIAACVGTIAIIGGILYLLVCELLGR